jgi:hypothetical protein
MLNQDKKYKLNKRDIEKVTWLEFFFFFDIYLVGISSSNHMLEDPHALKIV